MPKIQIRLAQADDASVMTDLVQSVLRATPHYPAWAREEESLRYDADTLMALIANPKALLVVAVIEGEIVGFAFGAFRDSGDLFLDWVGVAAHVRRSGVSLLLLRTIGSLAKQQGSREIRCEVNPMNGPSVAMIARAGYRSIGKRRMWAGIEHQEWRRRLRGRKTSASARGSFEKRSKQKEEDDSEFRSS